MITLHVSAWSFDADGRCDLYATLALRICETPELFERLLLAPGECAQHRQIGWGADYPNGMWSTRIENLS